MLTGDSPDGDTTTGVNGNRPDRSRPRLSYHRHGGGCYPAPSIRKVCDGTSWITPHHKMAHHCVYGYDNKKDARGV